MSTDLILVESNIVDDITSPSGQRIVGFNSYYRGSLFSCSCAMFNDPNLTFCTADGYQKKIRIDDKIEPLSIYHHQYGIPVSDTYNCFFITSWLNGIYCCSLDNGIILWNYRLKHATKILLYDDYLLCAFQGIGLRKISYEGIELAKYPITTYQAFYSMDKPYVFCGPNRGSYLIIDTQTMEVCDRIKGSVLSPISDPYNWPVIINKLEGTRRGFTVSGFENEQPFERRIQL